MEMRRSKAGHVHALGLVTKGIREDGENVTREPLPERWIDLIHHLNELERLSTAGPQQQSIREHPRNHSDNSNKTDR